MMQYGLPTLSLISVLQDLWESICGFFDMIGSVISMVFTFIDSVLTGMAHVITYLVTSIPIATHVINVMPAVIAAAASVTLMIFLLRFLFGAFIG